MARLFIVLGVLLFCGGVAAIAYGLPYLVLEYGFTIVIAGTVGATGGLILVGVGLILGEVRRMARRTGSQAAPAEAAMPKAEPTANDPAQPDSGLTPAVAGMAATVLGGTTVVAQRSSAFNRIEQALGDVLESTKTDTGAPDGSDHDTRRQGDDAPVVLIADDEPAFDFGREDLGALPADAAVDKPADPEEKPEAAAVIAKTVSSDEGVVRAYTVGDASFTMYANGTIRADTPDGQLTFVTMDDLKAYLAARPPSLRVR